MAGKSKDKLNKTEIKCQHFSDGLMIYVPLRADDVFDYLQSYTNKLPEIEPAGMN